jgi:hypothetical protein
MFLMVSCGGIKPGASKTVGQKYFETFFVGNQGTQYFIKPFEFQSTETKSKGLIADITWRYKDKLSDSTIVNMSIIDQQTYKTVDSIFIKSNSTRMKLSSINLLFVEKSGSNISSRFSSKGLVSDLREIFKSNDWLITVYSGKTKIEYIPTSKSKKIISTLDENVFSIF